MVVFTFFRLIMENLLLPCVEKSSLYVCMYLRTAIHAYHGSFLNKNVVNDFFTDV